MPGELLYRIIDEPKESSVQQWAVKPFWPWLALLLGGGWIGVPWFIFNAIALGSATRRREIVIAALLPVAVVGAFLISHGVGSALELKRSAGPYLLLVAIATKLALAYVLFNLQSRAAQLQEHFGQRPLRQGAIVAVGAFLLRDRVLEQLPALLQLGLL